MSIDGNFGKPDDLKTTKESALTALNFNQLKEHVREALELGKRTVGRVENGFETATEEYVYIRKNDKNLYVISQHSEVFYEIVANYFMGNPLQYGSPDKEVMMTALRDMLEEHKYRIIE